MTYRGLCKEPFFICAALAFSDLNLSSRYFLNNTYYYFILFKKLNALFNRGEVPKRNQVLISEYLSFFGSKCVKKNTNSFLASGSILESDLNPWKDFTMKSKEFRGGS
jgi:hypothetical protein